MSMEVKTTAQKLALLKCAAEYFADHDMVVSDEDVKSMLAPMLPVFEGICEGICGGAMDLCDNCPVCLYARDIKVAIDTDEKKTFDPQEYYENLLKDPDVRKNFKERHGYELQGD